MNLLWAILIAVGAVCITVTAMLLVRRRAPAGSYFADGDRASGVFGVLATGFSVLLGFIIFLAFTSYDHSRPRGEQEALRGGQQVETAQFLPHPASQELTGQLVCYARYVVYKAWPQLEANTLGDAMNRWAASLCRTLRTVQPQSNSEQAACSKWLDQTSDREAARSDRIHGAVGVIPTPLWIVLFFISGVIFLYMLFFADSSEGPFTQAMLMGSVTSVIVLMLLLLNFLDSPFHKGVGGLKPVAMQRTLLIMAQEL